MNSVKIWWRAVRPFSFTVSVVPPILGTAIAAMDLMGAGINWLHFFLTVFGCVVVHAGANLLSDYFDFRKGVDREETYGSSRVIIEGLLSPKQVVVGSLIAFVIALLIGAFFAFTLPGGEKLLWLIVLGGLLAVFYTCGPIQLKYHALGDISVFIAFGPAMCLGAYLVQTGWFSWTPVLYSLPIALLVDAILHSNNVRDFEHDAQAGVVTLAGQLGERNAKLMYYFLIFGPYLLLPILVVLAGLPVLNLLAFISFPLALKLYRKMQDKNLVPLVDFSTIDAETAQLHALFGIFLIVATVVTCLIKY